VLHNFDCRASDETTPAHDFSAGVPDLFEKPWFSEIEDCPGLGNDIRHWR